MLSRFHLIPERHEQMERMFLIVPSSRPTPHLRCGQLEVSGGSSVCDVVVLYPESRTFWQYFSTI